MCLGMVADFDERAGDYPAAITTLEAAIATNESLLGGFTGSLEARLGWALLHDGQTDSGRGGLPAGARRSPAGAAHDGDLPGPGRAGRAAPARTAATTTPIDAATEALDLYQADGFRRFRNRIDPTRDLDAAAAVCWEVLAGIAAERDEPDRAATLLGHADRLRGRVGRRRPRLPARRRRRRPGRLVAAAR